jgi:hypothetical protein
MTWLEWASLASCAVSQLSKKKKGVPLVLKNRHLIAAIGQGAPSGRRNKNDVFISWIFFRQRYMC